MSEDWKTFWALVAFFGFYVLAFVVFVLAR